MRKILKTFAAITLTLSLLAGCENEVSVIDFANDQRTAIGVPALEMDWTKLDYAYKHTKAMADNHDLHHGNLSSIDCGECTRLGENVGYGSSLEQINEALMNSPGHRQNILDERFDTITVSVVQDENGTYWVTQVFIGY